MRTPPDRGSLAAGVGSITVGLGPAGRAPGSVETVPPPTALKTNEPIEELDDVMPDKQVQETLPDDTDELEVFEEETKAVDVVEQVDPDIIKVMNPESLEEVEVKVLATTEPEPTSPVGDLVVARAPDPQAVANPVLPSPRRPLVAEENPEPLNEEVVADQIQVAGAGGQAGDQADGDIGSGQSASGGGAAGVRADYFAMLQAWLEQHKVYPRRALSRRLEGVVALRFVMSKDGRVLDYRIEDPATGF